MAKNRAAENLIRLEKIKARKAAKLGASSLVHTVENAAISEPVATIEAPAEEIIPRSPETAPAAIILSAPKFDDSGPGVEGLVVRKAKVYAKPLNVRMRLIEFEDGSHGKLWVRPDAAPMLSWLVWVKPSGMVRGDWELHGKYNYRGVRTR